ncbi:MULTISPECIES: toxin-antitoxin system YwqK family antitoxin [Fusobacterium]|uniref:Phosphatidylinositol-4-phosphate 5-kinase n=1 Tax=Fusobacterium nucleatum subsp. polymorphum TaxID=76857 RepID=A0A2C6ATL3_FUSNP|nr:MULTISPECIES: toxin-antitoxin system YwqK family antitoxin [Fusobacterium]EUB21055.1 MORN repeat protein [Fusobacterium sp. CM22]PHH96657.1 phosphatidylinositol-4-phosphate 5-kinase [Fusobacterium polymorphum]
MRKNFLVLIFLFFTFSILNAKPLKTEAELQNIRNKADKIVREELKNDYKKEYLKRKNNLEKIEDIKESVFSDGEFVFRLEDGIVTEALKTIETIHNTTVAKIFDEEGNLLTIIFSVNDENSLLYRYYDKDLNLAIDINCIDGKCIQKGYYSNKKLAYIKEGKLTEKLDVLANGKYTEYYKNGKIKIQGNYKEGRRNGEFKVYLKNGKGAGSVIYKDGKIIKSTLIKTMKDNASFSPISYVNYDLDTSYSIGKVDFPNKLLKTYYMYDKNEVLNGDSIKYYEEGNIQSIVPYKNNLVEGLVIRYYENGNIDEEVNYKNNKMNGEAKSYDENGKLNGRTIFKDDIKLEEDVYKENEILKNTFKNGELVKQDICTLNGTLKERRILNGDELEYSTFYPNGNVKQKILTKDKIIIKEQIYARNGNIMSNSFFSDGKPVIELFEYYPDGKLFRKISTVNKMLNGDSIEYYPNGNIKEKTHFINNKEEGEHFFYDKNGNLIKTDIYKNDVKQ